LLVVLLAGLIWVGWSAAHDAVDRVDVQLPLLAIAGVLILLLALAVTAVAFATFGLDNKNEALALPPGSVRAVIALSLVVIFSILTVFLYASLSTGHETELLSNVTAADRDKFLAKFTADQLSHIASRPTGSVPDTSTRAATGATVPAYTVYNVNPPSQASQDFAKQLLVMLGVLLSSVTGFYFGAKTAAGTSDAGSRTRAAGGGGGGGASRTYGAAKLGAANVTATPEAAALGQDPTLASQASADNLNMEASYNADSQ
jgi:hypothetical protein